MTRDDLAYALERRWPVLNGPAMLRAGPFREAADHALAMFGTVAQVVEAVAIYGELRGARNPGAVIVARLGWAVADAETRQQWRTDESEARRWRCVETVAQRGETLRALVDRGELFPDEALDILTSEFADLDLRVIGVAALEGGRS